MEQVAETHPERRVALCVERARKGLSQEEVGVATGVSRFTVLKAERGSSVSFGTALKLAAFYGRPVEELFADLAEKAA